MVYQFKKSSYIKADAQVAGEMCERMAAEGRLTAKNLVDENRPEDAPLHTAFEWDDAVAAEAWRESQARHIINSLEVVTEDREPVRAYFNIVRAEPEYHHLETILQSADSTELLLKTALGELRAFERKYSQLAALAEVFAAIARAEEKATSKKRSKARAKSNGNLTASAD